MDDIWYIEKNKSAYDRWASTYDSGNNPHLIMEHAYVLDAIDAKIWDRILDAWCWTWKYAIEFHKKWAHVIGCDLSPKMIEKAKKKDESILYDVVDLSKKLPYGDNAFDKINCSQVLKHIRDLKDTFGEFYRVLKKWGVLVFSVSHPERPKEPYALKKSLEFNLPSESDIFHHRFFDYLSWIDGCGFQIVDIKQIVLNEKVEHLIDENDYRAMKWRPEIAIFILKK